MTNTTHTFNETAQPTAVPKSQTPSPFCLRLSVEEREILERRAGRMPLGHYIRACLFGESVTRRRKTRKAGSDAQKFVAQLLAALGQSGVRQNIAHLLTATQRQPELFTAELCAVVAAARDDVVRLRKVLIDANRHLKSVQQADVAALKSVLKRLKNLKRKTQLDDIVNTGRCVCPLLRKPAADYGALR